MWNNVDSCSTDQCTWVLAFERLPDADLQQHAADAACVPPGFGQAGGA